MIPFQKNPYKKRNPYACASSSSSTNDRRGSSNVAALSGSSSGMSTSRQNQQLRNNPNDGVVRNGAYFSKNSPYTTGNDVHGAEIVGAPACSNQQGQMKVDDDRDTDPYGCGGAHSYSSSSYQNIIQNGQCDSATNGLDVNHMESGSTDNLPSDDGAHNGLKRTRHSLQNTLLNFYGFDTFRDGQEEVIKAVIFEKKDAAVFWSTGRGKSLCFQLPALHSGKTAIVISPLISLMQDQCAKLNALSGNKQKVATYLGSAQRDLNAEDRAMRGEYKVVYVTPERILASSSFLPRLAALKENHGISLIAIDEAHCISQYGHDFRPDFMKLGVIRNHPVLSQVPIVALTATAVPRVQTDILTSLKMRSPMVSIRSFDRENLQISVRRRPDGGFRVAFKGFVAELNTAKQKGNFHDGGGHSTIIYVRTRDSTERIASWLNSQLMDAGIKVGAYHAGLPLKARDEIHTAFLVGSMDIVVSTVAFGMGIDKPDVRNILHWEPPKTVEEYYQQIGRAGRDGLSSRCMMWCNESDFANYQDDFYLGKIDKGEARDALINSINALKKFAMTSSVCRRASILRFFNERPSFGEHCGTCDVCVSSAKYQNDASRDFFLECRSILLALNALKPVSLTKLEKVVRGIVVDKYAYRRNAGETQKLIQASNREAPKRKSGFWKIFLPYLIEKDLVSSESKTVQIPGHTYSKTYVVYSITWKGMKLLEDAPNASLILSVPQELRDLEAQEREKREALLAKIKHSGVDLETIPKEELDVGDGEVIRAYSYWLRYLERTKERNFERHEELVDLYKRIKNWRLKTALSLKVAPANIMSEHLVSQIAYASATATGVIDEKILHDAGVRVVTNLAKVIEKWNDETGNNKNRLSNLNEDSSPIALKQSIFSPIKPWQHAIYKPVKKTGLASWESSYLRFMKGENPHSIAMSPTNGRPIQVATVVNHLFQALTHGRTVDLGRLFQVIKPPNKHEWECLVRCESETDIDVLNSEVLLRDLLMPIVGREIIEKDFKGRTEEEQAKYRKWCKLANMYMSLRRCGFEPVFEERISGSV